MENFTNIGMACRLIKKNRVDLLLRSIKFKFKKNLS